MFWGVESSIRNPVPFAAFRETANVVMKNSYATI
jgi:hypothetical protein